MSVSYTHLGKEVVHPKRDPGISEGVSVRIVGMIIASPAGIDGLAMCAHLVLSLIHI